MPTFTVFLSTAKKNEHLPPFFYEGKLWHCVNLATVYDEQAQRRYTVYVPTVDVDYVALGAPLPSMPRQCNCSLPSRTGTCIHRRALAFAMQETEHAYGDLRYFGNTGRRIVIE